MRFMKFGKAFLMSALSAGAILGITSCVQSYSVGYLFVTGTDSSSSSTNNGIVSGFKIDHNTGKLTPINGLPISSGGANPVRAVLLTGGRFVYVLNQGVNAEGTADCTTADPCTGSNITLFSIGGNGILSPQGTQYFTQGKNPMRMVADPTGSYLYVLDHDAPDNYAASYNPLTNGCTLALGSGVQTCGDVSTFKIDANTGRLTTVVNAQVTSASGAPLAYFPVPANAIDFTISGSYVFSLSGTPDTGDSVFPYTYNSANGQLTISSNSSQPLNIKQATAIVPAGSYIYVLDNEPLTYVSNNSSLTVPSQILQFSAGTSGALQQVSGGTIPGDGALENPVYLIQENQGKWVYVAYQGNNDTSSGSADSGLAGWVVDPSSHLLTPEIGTGPWGTGSGPACLLEDPSHQFIYSANFKDSTVTGRALDVVSGSLKNLPGSANKSYPLNGPATWCIASGRTS
ncbi:MAG TPA: hypothetical protein VG893_05950 [Terracidiphilus sp.]|nr:hypothetical protein [Terracidiphilus sp.]